MRRDHALAVIMLAGLLVAGTARAQDPAGAIGGAKKFGIIAKAGVAIPVGEFSDLFTTGFAGYLEVPYDLTPSMQAFASVGYTKFTVDEGKLADEMRAAGIAGTATLDAPYRIIPVLAGIKFFSQYGKLWPYFSFSGGFYAQELKTSGSITDSAGTRPIGPTSESWSQGAFGVGLGTMIELGDGWAVDIDAKFNSVIDYEGRVLIGTSSSENVSTRAIKFASVLAGIGYKF